MAVQRLLWAILSATVIITLCQNFPEFCDKRDNDYNQYIIQCHGINRDNMDLLREVLIAAKLKHPQYELLIHLYDSVGADLPVDIFDGYRVKTIAMTSCNFTYFPYDILSYLPNNVDQLDLSKNAISEISFTRFNELPFAGNLTTLTLQSNRIAYLQEDAFANCTALTKINLQVNHLTEIPDNTFRGLTNLVGLYLNENRITNVGTDAFATLDHLRLLMLDVNDIKTLNNGTFSVDKQRYLYEIPLEGNPFHCNCSLQWLKEYLISINYLGASGATCAYPSYLPFGMVDFCATDGLPDEEGRLKKLKLK